MSRNKTGLGYFATILSICIMARAEMPRQFYFEDYYTTTNGPYTGNIQLQLQLYSDSNNWTCLYEDSNTVEVVDGFYTTTIGDNTVYGSLTNALKNGQAFVQVIVNGELLYPREPLIPVPYALNADSVASNAITSAMISSGAVQSPHLAAGAVTVNKLAGDVDDRYVNISGDDMTGILSAPMFLATGGGLDGMFMNYLFIDEDFGHTNGLSSSNDKPFWNGREIAMAADTVQKAGDTITGDLTLTGNLWSEIGNKIALGSDGDGDGEYLQNTGYGVGIHAGYNLIGDFREGNIALYQPVQVHSDLEVMGELSVWNGSPGTGPDVLARRDVGTTNDALRLYPDVPDEIPASIGIYDLWDGGGNIPLARLNHALSGVLSNYLPTATAASNYVSKSGDTMLGDFSLAGSLILLPTTERVLSPGFQSDGDVTIHWMTESGTYFKYDATGGEGDRFHFGSDGEFKAWGNIYTLADLIADRDLAVGGRGRVQYDPEIGTNQYALWVRNFASTPNDARGLLVTTPEYNGNEGIIFHAASLAGGSMASRFIVGADGNVGVGVNNPQSRLHVAGDTRVSGNILMMDGQNIISPNFNPGTWGSGFDAWGPNAYLKYGFVRELLVAQNAEFQSKVMIGTSSDYAQLNVAAPTNLVTPTYAARFESRLDGNSDHARGVLVNFPYTTNADSILFHAMSGSGPATNSRFIVKADGKVGIGTPDPEAKLHVHGDARFDGLIYGDGSGLTNLPVTGLTTNEADARYCRVSGSAITGITTNLDWVYIGDTNQNSGCPGRLWLRNNDAERWNQIFFDSFGFAVADEADEPFYLTDLSGNVGIDRLTNALESGEAKFVGDGSGLVNLPVTGLTTNESDARYLNVSGDTLQGDLRLQAAIRGYGGTFLSTNLVDNPTFDTTGLPWTAGAGWFYWWQNRVQIFCNCSMGVMDRISQTVSGLVPGTLYRVSYDIVSNNWVSAPGTVRIYFGSQLNSVIDSDVGTHTAYFTATTSTIDLAFWATVWGFGSTLDIDNISLNPATMNDEILYVNQASGLRELKVQSIAGPVSVSGNLEVSGGVSVDGWVAAALFTGDGSGLTNLSVASLSTNVADTRYVRTTGDNMIVGSLKVDNGTGDMIELGVNEGITIGNLTITGEGLFQSEGTSVYLDKIRFSGANDNGQIIMGDETNIIVGSRQLNGNWTVDGNLIATGGVSGASITAESFALTQSGPASLTLGYDANWPAYPVIRSGSSEIYFGIPSDPSLWFNFSMGTNIIFGDLGNRQNVQLFGDLHVDGTLHGDGSGLTNLPVTGLSTNEADVLYVNTTGDSMTGALSVNGSNEQTNLTVTGWAKIDYISPQGGISMGIYTNR